MCQIKDNTYHYEYERLNLDEESVKFSKRKPLHNSYAGVCMAPPCWGQLVFNVSRNPGFPERSAASARHLGTPPSLDRV
jgi:hypothetical protein